MRPARFKVINQNYIWTGGAERLVLAAWQDKKPWAVYGDGRLKAFRTHAEAITYATKQARKRKGKK